MRFMPIYEYQCQQCGHRFEVLKSMGGDSSNLCCPKCGAPDPRRLISSFFSPGSSDVESSGGGYPTCSSGTCGLPPMP